MEDDEHSGRPRNVVNEENTEIVRHLAMKGKRYADVDAIQKGSTAILNAIPKDDLKKSFDNLLDRANHCIQC